jgi:Protein of unknown function, DUF417
MRLRRRCVRPDEVLCHPIFHLSFPQHVHELDADSRGLCGVKRFEAPHGSRQPFHRTMILFHPTIHIFHLANGDRGPVLLVGGPDGPGIGLAPVDGNEGSIDHSTTAQMAAAYLLRYGLVLVIAWIGLMKFTAYEAAGIQPLVSHSPLMRWVDDIFSERAFSALLGVVEITIAATHMLTPRPAPGDVPPASHVAPAAGLAVLLHPVTEDAVDVEGQDVRMIMRVCTSYR